MTSARQRLPNPSGDNNFDRRRAIWRDQLFDDMAGIGKAAFAIGFAISRHLYRKTFTAWPGRVVLAKEVILKLRAVDYGLGVLKTREHLKITRNKGGKLILTPIIKSEAIAKRGNGHDADAAPLWPADYRETFWNTYPRKQEGHYRAIKAIEKLADGSDRPPWQELHDGLVYLEEYARTCSDEQRKTIRSAKRWLEEKGWEDRPESDSENEYRGVRP
jgi:hypothetical protein